jgi:alpha-D-ribose 1-methylphosphonate 5-triphosphate synthase subunit PhnG
MQAASQSTDNATAHGTAAGADTQDDVIHDAVIDDVGTAAPPHQTQRRAAMAILSHCSATDIAVHLDGLTLPGFTDLRTPEAGLVMVRGRIGGDGAAFNLGEATVSRAAVRLDSGAVGFGYTLGRDPEKARLIALCDALIQSPEFAAAIESVVLTPLRAAVMSARQARASESAATRVDFYTLVRGEG